MNMNQQESDGATRVAYILGVPLAENVVRQWPQMGEIVRTSRLVAEVEGNFPELTLTPEGSSPNPRRENGRLKA
jgi:hypothetical protein